MSVGGTSQAVSSKPVDAGGSPTRIPVGGGAEEPELTNPRWGQASWRCGDELEMLVDAPAALEGRQVQFVVEHAAGQGRWEPLGTTSGTVAQGTAVGLLEVRHPAMRARRDGMIIPAGTDVGPRTLRFHASLA